MLPVQDERRYLAGADAISEALDARAPVRVLLIDRDDPSPRVRALVDRARARGVEVWLGGAGDLRRMARSAPPPDAIAMCGPPPRAELPELLARDGAVFWLDGAAYPSNVGFTIRTAEVAGAAGVVVTGEHGHDARSRASHVSMGADRLLPVVWSRRRNAVLDAVCESGSSLVAIEDVGAHAPWEVDLTGPVVLVAGNERSGLDDEVLAACERVVRIPMAGFVPSYNLQAAISAVACERLRQLAVRT